MLCVFVEDFLHKTWRARYPSEYTVRKKGKTYTFKTRNLPDQLTPISIEYTNIQKVGDTDILFGEKNTYESNIECMDVNGKRCTMPLNDLLNTHMPDDIAHRPKNLYWVLKPDNVTYTPVCPDAHLPESKDRCAAPVYVAYNQFTRCQWKIYKPMYDIYHNRVQPETLNVSSIDEFAGKRYVQLVTPHVCVTETQFLSSCVPVSFTQRPSAVTRWCWLPLKSKCWFGPPLAVAGNNDFIPVPTIQALHRYDAPVKGRGVDLSAITANFLGHKMNGLIWAPKHRRRPHKKDEHPPKWVKTLNL